MAKKTEKLKLFKWDTSNQTDLESQFDINKSLNENWDKLDLEVGYSSENVKKLINQIPKGTASGDSITLNDSSNLPVEDILLKGKMVQETREGYNLIDYSNIATSKDGITVEYDEETGYITANGTQTKAWVALFQKNITDLVEDNTTYTLGQSVYNNAYSTGIYAQITVTNLSTNTDSFYYCNTKPLQITTDLSNYKYSFSIQLANYSLTLNNYKNAFMLYKGTDTKPYEKYGASPSIEFPSEIQSVSGENKFIFNNKNWFKIPDDSVPTNQSLNGLTVTIKNGEITINGTATADWANLTSNIPINIKAGTYTFSRNNSSYDLVLKCYKADGTYKEVWLVNSFKTTTTFPEDIVEYYVYVGGFSVGTVFTDFKLKLQLEEGSTATDHIEHQSQNYPISLGENEMFEDEYIYKLNDKWFKHTKFGIITNFSFGIDNPVPQGFYMVKKDMKTGGKIYSTVSKVKPTGTNYAKDEDWLKMDGNLIGQLYVGFKYIYINTTQTQINSILNNLGAKIYYELETPIETEITDSTLIAQLEALINAESYKGITHINTSGDDLNPEVEVIYKKDLETMFNNFNTAIVALGGV